MAPKPPNAVIDAYLSPVSHITRRVEIYENDAITPWKPELWDRLVEGSVNQDYGRDERRSCEMVLDNYDGLLDHTPGNLWYDKIFKVFTGIHVDQQPRNPTVAIIEEYAATDQALALKTLLNAAGITRVRINATTTSLLEVQDADIIISISSTFSQKLSLLTSAFNSGKSVMTFNPQSTAAQLPLLIGTAAASPLASATISAQVNTAVAHPIQAEWSVTPPAWTLPTSAIRQITAAAAGATVVGQILSGATTSSGILAYSSPSVANWVHVQMGKFDTITDPAGNFKGFLRSAISWLDTYEPIEYWETQIAEVLPDAIENNETDDLISVSCRDYTARCLASHIVNATAFAAGTSITTIVRSLASNAGITKFNIAPSTAVLPLDVVYERGAERWTIMKEVAGTVNMEVFFDARGYLMVVPHNDPSLTPPALTLDTGMFGNLVSETNKASSVSLFNHVVVIGEGPDSRVEPIAAEAKNINASSPSSIQKIGDRVYEIKSGLIATQAQAQMLADSLLKVTSLEEFELSFSAIMFPWLTVGSILEITQERVGVWFPTRYLITSLDFPLDMSPMSGSAKRVSIVL